jgi:hypothetical protein
MRRFPRTCVLGWTLAPLRRWADGERPASEGGPYNSLNCERRPPRKAAATKEYPQCGLIVAGAVENVDGVG